MSEMKRGSKRAEYNTSTRVTMETLMVIAGASLLILTTLVDEQTEFSAFSFRICSKIFVFFLRSKCFVSLDIYESSTLIV